jgi:hypothetical protein
MSTEAHQSRLTEARYAVRRYLYARPTVAQDVATITHGLRVKGQDFDQSEIEVALHFWEGCLPAQIAIVRRSEADPAKHFQITSAGIIAFEREQ